MQAGVIKLVNAHGVLCDVPYRYDEALQAFELVPHGKFTADDVARATAIAPNWIEALILTDISERKTGFDPYLCRPRHAAA